MNSLKNETLTSVEVDLGDKSYPIHIASGLLKQAGAYIAEKLPGARCVIITDNNVAETHLETLLGSLTDAQVGHAVVTVLAGEGSKSFDTLQHVVDEILNTRFERTDAVIGFGGGVIGDLAGFAASIVRRGMHFIQIPTTLLAQVDSSVGGKTGINAPQGKNLIGAFLQPKMVLIDPDVLGTLSPREFRAGYAEMLKYGLINDVKFFNHLEENWQEVFDLNQHLIEAIATSCRAKAAIVAEDEFEMGKRALLNLGHTFGHALEGAVGYNANRLVHGEGVAIGMVLAHRFSNRMNLCDADSVERVTRHLMEVGLPVSIEQIPGDMPDAEGLLEFITQDKKVSGGKLTFILTKGLGKSYIAKDVPASEVQLFLEYVLKEG